MAKDNAMLPVYGRSEFKQGVPKLKIPETPMAPESAYRMIKDSLNLDGSPALNLATYANTWMDDYAEKLIHENLDKNFIDHEEYPQSSLIEKRLIRMMGDMLGTEFDPADTDPDTSEGFYGSVTVGSSEAIMLALIAHRKHWQNRNKMNPNRSPLDRPFLLMSTHVHGCWDKYCRYYDVGALYIAMGDDKYTVTHGDVSEVLHCPIKDSPYREQIIKLCEYPDGYLPVLEERTVGELVMAVGSIAGTTFTGNGDDTEGIDEAVDAYCKAFSHTTHVDIPIHVDGASGGFMLPFTNQRAESMGHKAANFDFKQTKRVRSINVSNHKFGMVYPGMGSVIFRNKDVVDPELIYNITYLGGSFVDYTVNFSRGSGVIISQYYNFLSWGRQGYQAVLDNCMDNTDHLINCVTDNPTLKSVFTPISDNVHYPIVVFKREEREDGYAWSMADFADEMREYGWIIASYQLPTTDPEKADGPYVLRIVVRQVITSEQIESMVNHMTTVVDELEKLDQTTTIQILRIKKRTHYKASRI
ncbi:pyridoxal-dependent decarboxylase [Vibrio sp. ZSDE26]|uniref:glutamate decarboxylase n=1 Tax=Vibrio amylolyticus TaxID=2847292 RepID=A0A9X1XR80_9VIBR|nr:pyridoxal-dependent decarboxylase [Vibrio amylolyticus]MCK6264084.1 pyridoxal-dependent decarboxylase [Vibrio amylolyticus]